MWLCWISFELHFSKFLLVIPILISIQYPVVHGQFNSNSYLWFERRPILNSEFYSTRIRTQVSPPAHTNTHTHTHTNTHSCHLVGIVIHNSAVWPNIISRSQQQVHLRYWSILNTHTHAALRRGSSERFHCLLICLNPHRRLWSLWSRVSTVTRCQMQRCSAITMLPFLSHF